MTTLILTSCCASTSLSVTVILSEVEGFLRSKFIVVM
jgi:hypothetical protein